MLNFENLSENNNTNNPKLDESIFASYFSEKMDAYD